MLDWIQHVTAPDRAAADHGAARRDMTTLDVGIAGPQWSIDLSNGLLGAATDVFMAAGQAVREGKATGTVELRDAT